MNPQTIAHCNESGEDIRAELCRHYDFVVLPLRLLLSDGEHLDGQTNTADGVYERLQHEIPTTSLPAGQSVGQIFNQMIAAGYEKVLAVHLSAGLSGTYNLVRLMGEDCEALEVRAFD